MSTWYLVPRPEHTTQAPYGLLNEKFLGWSSSNESPHFGQAKCWLKLMAGTIDHVDQGEPVRQPEGRLEGLGEPALHSLLAHQSIDDDLDRVLEVPVELDVLREVPDVAVDPGPAETVLGQVLEQLLVFAFTTPDDRRQHLKPGALRQFENLIDDLLRRLARHRASVVGTVRYADPGVQQPQVVGDLSDRPDGGSRIPGRGLLVDRDRG